MTFTKNTDTGPVGGKYGEQKKEGLIVEGFAPTQDMSDDDLVELADRQIVEAKPLHDEMLARQKRNTEYYRGNQLDEKKMDRFASRIVSNKIYQQLETFIPLAVGQVPSPAVTLPPVQELREEADLRKHAAATERMLLAIAQDTRMKQKLRDFVYNQQLKFLGVIKFGFDEDNQEVWVDTVRPENILLPRHHNPETVIEWHEDSVETLIEKFPDKESEIKQEAQTAAQEHRKGKLSEAMINGARMGYYEITTPEFKFWKLNQTILGKEDNPYWDNSEKKNHWPRKRHDYIFSDVLTFNETQYSVTTNVEQILPLQDAYNKRKRQIAENADYAQGHLVAYGQNGPTQEEVNKMQKNRRKPNGVSYLESAAPGTIQQFTGQQIQPFVYDDMIHSDTEMDDIFGTHSVTRGEKTPGEETFSGRNLLKDSDLSRIETYTQMVEDVAEQIYNAFAQIIKVKMDKEKYTTYLSPDGADQYIKIKKDMVKDGTKIAVRPGTSRVKEQATRSQEALVLWQNGAIDPVSLYERIGDQHPYRTAERFFLWQQQPRKLFESLTFELQEDEEKLKESRVLMGVVQAGAENKQIEGGNLPPPFEDAGPQHMAVHQEALQALQQQAAEAQNQEQLQALQQQADILSRHMQSEIPFLEQRIEEIESEGEEKSN